MDLTGRMVGDTVFNQASGLDYCCYKEYKTLGAPYPTDPVTVT